jgi:hypothetical protein
MNTMKRILTLAAVIAALACTVSDAASLNVSSNAANHTFSVYLDGAPQNGQFDTVDVHITPKAGAAFTNNDTGFNGFFPRAAGEPFTFINQLLAASTAQGGAGFSVLGAVNTPSEVAFAGGPLGLTITTPAAPGLFLANIQLPSGAGTAKVDVISGGNITQSLSADFGAVVPEPATVGLGAMSLLGLAFAARRRK